MGTPYYRSGDGMLELPVQVTRGPRLPYFGTSLTLLGDSAPKLLTKMCVGEPLVNLELHGIDVLDAADGLEALRPHQVDVRVPKEKKLSRLAEAFSVLRSEGYSFVTLSEAAEVFS